MTASRVNSGQAFVDIALRELHVREVTPNASPAILNYRDATTLGRNGLPDASWFWCSAFVCWVQREFFKGYAPELLPFAMRSARADDWERWNFPGVQRLPVSRMAKRGDIVTFEFDGDSTAEHVGIVVSNQTEASRVETIEGNTFPHQTARDGGKRLDGVYRMQRSTKLVRKLIRWLPLPAV